MDETKTDIEQTLAEKISGVRTPKIFRKERLSIFRLFETVNWKFFHFQRYYEQIVNEPKITDEERSQIIVEESNQAVSKQRSKKTRWISTGFLLLNLAIVIGIFIWSFAGSGQQMSIAELLSSNINWVWLLVGVAVFFLINWSDSLRVFALIFHATKKPRVFLSYKSNCLCRFYDNVTPLASGGQPFQIFYLNKRGIPAGIATSVPLAKYLYAQFLSMIFIAVVLILQHTYIVSLNPFILTMCYVGFALNFLLLGSILFLSVSKKVGPSCAIGVLKLLSKMKIVKDYRKAFVKVMHTVRDYVATMKKFLTSGWLALAMVFLSVIYFVFFYSVPFVVYATFVPLGSNWIDVFVQLFTIAVVCDMACCFIPIPGATGMAELSFGVLFGQFLANMSAPSNIVVWALLLWRIFTYYGYLIQGLGVMFYDFCRGNRKYEKLKQKQEGQIKVVKSRRKK